MLFPENRQSDLSPANDGRLLRKDIFGPKSEKRNVTGMRGFRRCFFGSFFAFFFVDFCVTFFVDFLSINFRLWFMVQSRAAFPLFY